jgi:hypothetical protein
MSSFYLRPWLYTHSTIFTSTKIVSGTLPCPVSYEKLLDFVNALNESRLLSRVSLSDCLPLCKAHFQWTKEQTLIFYNLAHLYASNQDNCASSSTPTITFLLVLFAQLQRFYNPDLDTLSLSHRDPYSEYKQQCLFWKSQFKEFICLVILLKHGPKGLEESASDSNMENDLNIPVVLVESVLDLLFFGMSALDAKDLSKKFLEKTLQKSKSTDDLSAPESTVISPVSPWFRESVLASGRLRNSRISFKFIKEFLDWGLEIESFKVNRPVESKHGLLKSLYPDIHLLPGKSHSPFSFILS